MWKEPGRLFLLTHESHPGAIKLAAAPDTPSIDLRDIRRLRGEPVFCTIKYEQHFDFYRMALSMATFLFHRSGTPNLEDPEFTNISLPDAVRMLKQVKKEFTGGR